MTMADTVAVMNEGVIEQMGPPTELYESPKTAFVANFLGQSNLFPAKVVELTGEDLILEDIRRAIHHAHEPGLRPGGHNGRNPGARRGAAGEDLDRTTVRGRGYPRRTATSSTVTCTSMSFLGVSTQYEVRTKGGDMINVFAQNLDVHNVLPPGTEVRLTWLPHHGFVLGGSEDIHAGMDQAD